MKEFVGNDLVDLNTPDALAFPQNASYVKRVLSDPEQALLRSSSNQQLIFWIHWSAKEAVYKQVKKMHPDTVFNFKLYRLELSNLSEQKAHGYVYYEGVKYFVDFSITPQYLHCISIPISSAAKIHSLVRANSEIVSSHFSFSEKEMVSIHSNESILARCLVKRILVDDFKRQFEIIRQPLLKKFGPPEVWLEGKRVSNIDVSLSHDGAYCAGLVLVRSP